MLRDSQSLYTVAVASVGTWIWTGANKGVIEKASPMEVEHPVQASGYSYPSGHSLVGISRLYLAVHYPIERPQRDSSWNGMALILAASAAARRSPAEPSTP